MTSTEWLDDRLLQATDPFILRRDVLDVLDAQIDSASDDPLAFYIRTSDQSGLRQIRIGDQALPEAGTVPPQKTWTRLSGTCRGGFISLTLRGDSGYPIPRTGYAPVVTGTTSVVPAEQADAASGDFQIVAILTTTDSATATAPGGEGWIALYSVPYTGRWTINLWRRVRGSDAPGAFTAAGATGMVSACVSYVGVDATPTDLITATSGLSSTFTSPALGATTYDNERVVIVGGFDFLNGAGTLADPADSQYPPIEDGGFTPPADIVDQGSLAWDADNSLFAAADPAWIVANLKEGNSAADNATILDAALAKAAALSTEGATVYIPAGRFLIPWDDDPRVIPSNITLQMADRCVLDFTDADPGGIGSIFLVEGAEDGYDSATFQFLTANVAKNAASLAVSDSSQYDVGDYIRLSSTEVWDPGARNGWIGEICEIAAIPDSTTLTLRIPTADSYVAGPHVTATPTTLSAGVNSSVTVLPVADATTYRTSTQNKPGRLLVGTEEITYLWRDSTNFYGCVRGARSTSAASHLSGVTVTELGAYGVLSNGGTLSNSATSIPLTSAAQIGIPEGSFGAITNGFILIDSELIYYKAKSSNTLTGCVRGMGGTAAATHTDGSLVVESDAAWVTKLALKTDVTIKGGTIEGPDFDSTDNNFFVGVWLDKTLRARVQGTKFINCKTMSVAMYDSVEATVEGINSRGSDRNNYGYGVAIEYASRDCKIINNYFQQPRHAITHGNPISNSRYSVSSSTKIGTGVPRRILNQGNHCWFSNLQTYDCHAGADDIAFIDNWSYGSQSNGGFWINCPRVTIRGNHVINPTGTAVFLQNLTVRSTSWKIHGNVFDGGTSHHIQHSHESLAARPNVGCYTRCISIVDNEFARASRSALILGGGSSTGGGTTWTSGIYLPNVVVARNVCTNAGRGTSSIAMNIVYLDNPVIADNTITEPFQIAMTVNTLQGGSVKGNTMSYRTLAQGWTGINALACTDTVFSANLVKNAVNGIALDNSCTYCTVMGNNGRGCTTPISRGSGTGHILKTTDGATAGDYNRL